jgi:hypothetical protein
VPRSSRSSRKLERLNSFRHHPRRRGVTAGVARKIEFVEAVQRDSTSPVPNQNIFRFPCRANHLYKLAPSRAHSRGVSRSSRTLGAGCGGRLGAARRAARKRTAKSCGPDAPTLASSWRKRFRWRQWQESPVTGESAKETVKTIARGMPGVSGVTVVTNARAFYTPRAAAGASGARHSLRP